MGIMRKEVTNQNVNDLCCVVQLAEQCTTIMIQRAQEPNKDPQLI